MARRRRQARRADNQTPGWLLFIGGVVFGLGIATVAWIGGYLPRADDSASAVPSGRDEPPIAEASEPPRRQYDFFQVLPEIEVVVPREEIEERAREREPAATDSGPYVLQVGSFRNAADADGLKARLALLGVIARVHEVTVNGVTWHRVRVGPYDSARETDQIRRQLQDNGFEAMVLSGGG